ncbi:MAG: hypothetical protein HC919_06265 [Oscillatoriales cyanobacterium SM2_2_1]|nr:hypothetical protein [Oscillatoriales cyanobacterium SM2_2_1]
MKIAVHNPYRCFGPQARNHNGYNYQFLRQFKPVLYLPEWRVRLNTTGTWREFLRSIKTALRGRFGLENSRGLSPLLRDCDLNPDEFDYAFSVAELKQKADVLVCFNGYPYREGNVPVKEFSGLKIYHAYEYVFRATESHRALADHGVDYVMGYTRHDRHCPFFSSFILAMAIG